MKPYPHQIKIAEEAYNKLAQYGLVYLSMEERTGKSLTAILTCEKTIRNRILIITKKKAIDGWEETLKKFQPSKYYKVINYEALHKIATNWDLIILDEAHANLSRFPKLGTRWYNVKEFTKGKPLIYLSATPSAQSYSQLYPQLKLSDWSPYAKWTTFYDWHRAFGIPKEIYIGSKRVKQYNECKPIAKEYVEHLFISYTRKELGFEHEPNDILHYVDLNEETREIYNKLNKDAIIPELDYIADTPMKKLVGLHQIEGGTLKNEDNYTTLPNKEKISYIKATFGDVQSLVIFYQYKQEELKLKEEFNNATILQGTSFAEGVDLSHFETLVVYSMDFSTARYTQRRARQCNMNRGEPIDVHFILVHGGISQQVYDTVAINKANFVNSYFSGEEL